MQPRTVLRRFCRRAAWAVFAVGFCRALAVVGLIWATAQILRLATGVTIGGPHVAQLALLVIPLGWGWYRARASAVSLADAAVLLDRRMGLGGLLIATYQLGTQDLGDGDAHWQSEVARRGEFAAEHFPRPDLQAVWRPLAVAAVMVAAVLLVPWSGPERSRGVDPALAGRVEGLQAVLGAMTAGGVVNGDVAGELERAVTGLAGSLLGGDLAWGDVDALADRLLREQSKHAGQLEQLLGRMGPVAKMLGAGIEDGGFTLDPQRLRQMVGLAKATGLLGNALERLPDELQQTAQHWIDRGMEEGVLEDLVGGGAASQALVRELVLEAQGHVARLGVVGPEENSAENPGENSSESPLPQSGDAPLGRRMLADLAQAWTEFSSPVGRGSARGDVVVPLPAGAGARVGGEVGVGELDSGAGGPEAAPSGNPVAWTQTVLPRHRQAVRRFFGDGTTNPKNK